MPVFAPCTIGFLMILAVENNQFLPKLYYYEHVLYHMLSYHMLSLWWVFVPAGVILLMFSVLAMRKSINGGFDRDYDQVSWLRRLAEPDDVV